MMLLVAMFTTLALSTDYCMTMDYGTGSSMTQYTVPSGCSLTASFDALVSMGEQTNAGVTSSMTKTACSGGDSCADASAAEAASSMYDSVCTGVSIAYTCTR